MAEQTTNVGSLRAKNVVIAPVQQNFGATGDGVRGWSEALLRGPLERSGQGPRALEAEEAESEGRHGAAADGFLAVAAALSDNDFGPAATSYRSRAADAYAKAGQNERAFSLHMALARGSLDEGDLRAVAHARSASRVASAENSWEAQALLARANWPEQEEGDVEALRRAWEKADGRPDEAEWAAALVELLLLNGEREPAIQIARDVCERLTRIPGPRLFLELDLLDLSEGLEDDDDLDRSWAELVAWAQNPELPLDATAMVLQRRGVALARRGDAEAARVAFLQATQAWTREPRYDDQAAEAFFSAISSGLALGDISVAYDDALPLARSLRGGAKTTTAHTERLELRGLRAVLGERHPDAHRQLATAHNLARRAGNLSDFFQVTEELGDLYLASGRPAWALAAYTQVGAAKKTRQAGEGLSVDDVLEAVSLEGARWERTAAWAAVAGAGRIVSDNGAATVAEHALAELDREPPSGFPPNPSFYAAEALAGVISAVPDGLLPRSLDVLRDRLQRKAGEPRQLAHPFLLVSLLGRVDETEILVDSLLDPVLSSSVPMSPLAQLVEERPDLQKRLLDAAKAGDRTALDFVDFSGLFGTDEELIGRARQAVRAAVAHEPREVTEENGTTTVSYGIGTSLAPVGMLARHCEEADRRTLAEKFVGILLDPDPHLPIMTRVSAAEGLHNLAPGLPGDVVTPVVDALSARAASDDEPADFDRFGVDDPLARFTVNMAPPGALQTAALDALSQVARHAPAAIPSLTEATVAALRSGRDQLLVAALNAVAVNDEMAVPGLQARPFLSHQNPTVRIAALDLVSAEAPVDLTVLERLLQDPSSQVRFHLIGIATDTQGGRELLEALSTDPDSYTRAMARSRLAESPSSEES
jgi:hypothetical protein